MLKNFYYKLKESFISVFPIYLLIMIASFTPLINLSGFEILVLSLSSFILIIGISLFNLGADLAMIPMGKAVGVGLTKQGKIWILIIIAFLLGLLITIAEPDLTVLANQTKAAFNPTLLILSVGIGVGLFLVFAILRIILKENLGRLLIFFYMILFSIVTIVIMSGNESILSLAFDSGGVTTGPITVPFLMALGVGVSSIVSKKSDKDASFGFISLCSVGPIIAVLILSIFSKGTIKFDLPDYSIPNDIVRAFFNNFAISLKEVGIALLLIVICFLIVDLIFIKVSLNKLIRLSIGIVYSYLGLALFLAAVSTGFMPIGYKIGTEIAQFSKYALIPFGFVLGMLTVLAEPAIHVLNKQVEEVTGGLIKKRSMLLALTIGVGLSLALSMIRIIYQFSILYYIIPGYIICFALSLFVPKIYTAIAFDSGGVASGPLTSSFILPLAIGACYVLSGKDRVLMDGFGLVAMVAMTPLITIELLGVISLIKDKRRTRLLTKRILESDDEEVINFM